MGCDGFTYVEPGKLEWYGRLCEFLGSSGWRRTGTVRLPGWDDQGREAYSVGWLSVFDGESMANERRAGELNALLNEMLEQRPELRATEGMLIDKAEQFLFLCLSEREKKGRAAAEESMALDESFCGVCGLGEKQKEARSL